MFLEYDIIFRLIALLLTFTILSIRYLISVYDIVIIENTYSLIKKIKPTWNVFRNPMRHVLKFNRFFARAWIL